eukprot:3172213-Pleurochrysis_carterae.AAC.1
MGCVGRLRVQFGLVLDPGELQSACSPSFPSISSALSAPRSTLRQRRKRERDSCQEESNPRLLKSVAVQRQNQTTPVGSDESQRE